MNADGIRRRPASSSERAPSSSVTDGTSSARNLCRDPLFGGRSNLLELTVDLGDEAIRNWPQELGRALLVSQQGEERPEVVCVRDPLQDCAPAAKPAAVSSSRRRVGDRARNIDALADGRDRETTAKQVGRREFKGDHRRTDSEA
jgi:hypothetical protein